MSERSWRPSLICSALLGALVIACGGPVAPAVAPVPAAAPAPVVAPEPAPAAEPAPAQRAAPAPEAGPASRESVAVPVRPGGASRLVDPSDADTVSNWWNAMKDNCESAGYERECVHYRVRYDGETDGPKSKYDDCDVTDRNPEGPVKRDTTIILDLDTTTCDLEPEQPEEENTGPGDPDGTGDTGE